MRDIPTQTTDRSPLIHYIERVTLFVCVKADGEKGNKTAFARRYTNSSVNNLATLSHSRSVHFWF